MTRWLALTLTLSLVSFAAAADPIPDITITNAEWDQLVSAGGRPRIPGSYYDVNQDTAYLFTTQTNQTLVIDDTIFFGILTSTTRQRVPILYSVNGSDPLPATLSAPEPAAALLAAAAAGLSLRRRRR